VGLGRRTIPSRMIGATLASSVNIDRIDVDRRVQRLRFE
jgi:hypothetical protein